MKVSAIDVQFPSRIVTKDDTLDLIKFHSKDSYNGDLRLALRTISRLLHISGASTRRWLSDSEKPIDFIVQAIENAIKRSSLDKKDIDLVIYTGVGRGFIEPGNAYLVSKAVGMLDVECFDVLDACMSFTRSLNLAHNYLKCGQYEHILIVNGEFNNIPGSILYPENYRLKTIEQVEYTFPTYTVGDVASATVVSKDDTKTWKWQFKSKTDWSDLCTAPITGYEGYTVDFERVGLNGEGNFCSFGNVMHDKGTNEIIDIFKTFNCNDAVQVFPHASSKSAWQYCAEVCGVDDKMYYVYPEYGNLVSASVPAGLYLSEKEEKINRGDKVMGWVGSAGMSFSTYSFEY